MHESGVRLKSSKITVLSEANSAILLVIWFNSIKEAGGGRYRPTIVQVNEWILALIMTYLPSEVQG